MLTGAAFATAAALLAATIPSADAHGYMLIPESQFKGSASSAWVVQIDPVWTSDKWDGNNPQSVDTFKSLKTANNFKDLKTLMDDTSVYGADCGFTDPDGTPQPIPTDGKATFSRALVHVGPCEIWLDDTKVLYEDDCFSKYGNENQDIKSVFPVDYSSCNSGGCKQMRFYWLAFQGLDSKTVWQSYKDCIPLTGSGGGGSSTSQTETSSSTSDVSQTTSSGDSNSPSSGDSNSPSSGDSNSPSSGDSNSPSSGDSNSPSSGDSATPAPASTDSPSANTPVVTPAPSSKCNGRKRRY
uniref:Mucin-like protein n=1 Tax=Phytophthora ramorum TaxID=164328 RepID=H3GPN8_PHYRM